MKFLLDQDIYALTARFLTDHGHDVVTAFDAGLSQVSDSALLRAALEQGRVLVTRDRDFGEIVFVEEMGTGVIYLRIRPSTLQAAHRCRPSSRVLRGTVAQSVRRCGTRQVPIQTASLSPDSCCTPFPATLKGR